MSADRSIVELEREATTLAAEISARRQRLQLLSRRHKEFRDKIAEIEQKTSLTKANVKELKRAPVVLMDEYSVAMFSLIELAVQFTDNHSELHFTEQQIKDTEEAIRILEIGLAQNTQERERWGKLILFPVPQ